MQMEHIEEGGGEGGGAAGSGEEMNPFSIFTDNDRCRMNPCLNSIITADTLFSSTFTSPCTSSFFGDSIGMESCIDVLQEADAASYFRHRNRTAVVNNRCNVGRDRRTLSAEFPPPMPSLARTENLQPRMPWVLRRDYTADGRLVLTEEKAPRHEYFLANRSNGRLLLHLVPMDDNHNHHEDVQAGVGVGAGAGAGIPPAIKPVQS